MQRALAVGIAVLICAVTTPVVAPAQHAGMVNIPAGAFTPLYATAADGEVTVDAFTLDRLPVTQAQYLAFVRANPEWRRSAVAGKADARSYLAGWKSDLDPGGDTESPVTGISWYAASAYCAAQPGGKRLPMLAEWEYVARASRTARNAARDAKFAQHLLTLYSTRTLQRRPVAASELNAFGVQGLHDLVWEWVADPNEQIAQLHHASHIHHDAGASGHDLGCSGAALGAADQRDYPAFLRYAVRSALTPTSAMITLGFRCAR